MCAARRSVWLPQCHGNQTWIFSHTPERQRFVFLFIYLFREKNIYWKWFVSLLLYTYGLFFIHSYFVNVNKELNVKVQRMLFDLRWYISTSSLRQWTAAAISRRRGRLWRSSGGVSRRNVGLRLWRPVGRQRCWGGVQTAGFQVCISGIFHTKLTRVVTFKPLSQTNASLVAPDYRVHTLNHTWSSGGNCVKG